MRQLAGLDRGDPRENMSEPWSRLTGEVAALDRARWAAFREARWGTKGRGRRASAIPRGGSSKIWCGRDAHGMCEHFRTRGRGERHSQVLGSRSLTRRERLL